MVEATKTVLPAKNCGKKTSEKLDKLLTACNSRSMKKLESNDYTIKPKCDYCEGTMASMIESNGKGVTTVLLVCYPCGVSQYTGATTKRGM